MTKTIEIVNRLRHEVVAPLLQSLKAHTDLAQNELYHISPKVLKDINKRIVEINEGLLDIAEEE